MSTFGSVTLMAGRRASASDCTTLGLLAAQPGLHSLPGPSGLGRVPPYSMCCWPWVLEPQTDGLHGVGDHPSTELPASWPGQEGAEEGPSEVSSTSSIIVVSGNSNFDLLFVIKSHIINAPWSPCMGRAGELLIPLPFRVSEPRGLICSCPQLGDQQNWPQALCMFTLTGLGDDWHQIFLGSNFIENLVGPALSLISDAFLPERLCRN